MLSVSSRIWTRVTVSIFNDGNHYTTGTHSLLMAVQKNTMRTNYTKATLDKTQQNSKCTLWGDRDEMSKHTISECSKQEQKE